MNDQLSGRGGSTMQQSVLLQRLSHFQEPNPALRKHAEERAQSVQNRIADQITAFAGSMWFVYIHIVWFGLWIGLGAEKYPYGLLTMIVSLEAIFLSTFVRSARTARTRNARSWRTWSGGRCRKRIGRTSSY
jgi:uncharacterized membrane protein